jgi:hypothetical protein
MQYHQSVDKLLLFVFGPLVFAAALLVIVTGVRRTVARFRSRPTPDQLKAAYDSFLRRLLNPQPDAVEKELGKFLPERLLQLYEDKSGVQAAGFQLEKSGSTRWRPKRWHVYCFEPLDLESLNELPYEEDLGPVFASPPPAAAPGIGSPPLTNGQKTPPSSSSTTTAAAPTAKPSPTTSTNS